MEILIAIGIGILLLLIKALYDSSQTEKRILNQIKACWGKCPEIELTPERIRAVRTFYDTMKQNGQDVDDITWNDVGMDKVFEMLNHTSSTIGEEYLYAILRKLEYKKDVLEEREQLITYFQEKEEERVAVQMALSRMGKLRSMSFFQELQQVKEQVQGKHIHILYGSLMAVSIAGFITAVAAGLPIKWFLIAVLACLANNIVQYYRRKAEIENSFYVLAYILKMLHSVDLLLSLNCEGINPYKARLKEGKKKYRAFRKKARFVSGGNNMSGDIADIILDYIRMIFHIDLIMYDSMIKELDHKAQDIWDIYEIIGKLDSSIAIASFRAYLNGDYCIPHLLEQEKPELQAVDIYHPFIKEPVKNAIREKGSVLITGSNASGKSTFIKTIAVNAILAQTIHTCMCKEYKASFFQIYSSMAVTDNLLKSESYYIAEIKSLKRILDKANDNVPTLCFVDEVLQVRILWNGLQHRPRFCIIYLSKMYFVLLQPMIWN